MEVDLSATDGSYPADVWGRFIIIQVSFLSDQSMVIVL